MRYDISPAGGGWTMVVAQFEQDPVTDWNEGIQADYDPSLSTGKGFALNSQELPSHTQTAFGKSLDADFIDYFYYAYSTSEISQAEIMGFNTGHSYYVHRNDLYNYDNHDVSEGIYSQPINDDWANTLSIDRKGGLFYTWAFSPDVVLTRPSSYGGFALQGDRRAINDNFAWTVWVR